MISKLRKKTPKMSKLQQGPTETYASIAIWPMPNVSWRRLWKKSNYNQVIVDSPMSNSSSPEMPTNPESVKWPGGQSALGQARHSAGQPLLRQFSSHIRLGQRLLPQPQFRYTDVNLYIGNLWYLRKYSFRNYYTLLVHSIPFWTPLTNRVN
jgi:hypothetical protein